MKVSFVGLFNQTSYQVTNMSKLIDDLYEVAKKEVEYMSDEADEKEKELESCLDDIIEYGDNNNLNPEGMLEIMHDIILGIAKGDCTPEELREFAFAGKDISELKYKGAITFEPKK